MSKPKALDLFCGAGGAGMGLHLAGFDVTGVDIAPQPRYPFPFHQSDAMAFPLDGFDFVWASPPCQRYSQVRKNCSPDDEHPDLVAPVRARLRRSGLPYAIENVQGAPLLRGSVMLCGEMFGLKTYRHRWFECRPMLLAPPHPRHPERCPRAGRLPPPGGYVSVCGKPSVAGARVIWSAAMGIDWMSVREMTQAIPPAYGRWIGEQVRGEVLRLRDLRQLDGAGGLEPHVAHVLDQRPIAVGLDLQNGHAGLGVAGVNDLGESNHVADLDAAGAGVHVGNYRQTAPGGQLEPATPFIQPANAPERGGPGGKR